MCIVGRVTGVAQLHNVLYVVCEKSSIIKTYTTDTLSPLAEDIHVKGMTDPSDIVACRHGRQLFVADYYCIWRVIPDVHSYVKWLVTTSRVNTLSLTCRRILMTSWWSPTIRQYSTANKELCVVSLQQYVKVLYHAVETTHGTFVVSHQGTSQDERQYAVSELFRLCHMVVTLIARKN